MEGALNNPVKVAEQLQKSPFGRYQDISINKRKNLIAVNAEDDLDSKEMEKLISITQIGDIKVKVYIKGEEDHQKHGVIYPIAIDTSMEELQNFIRVKTDSAYPNDHLPSVLKVERLKKKAGTLWVDSESVKVTFSGTKLPRAVTVHYSYYKVKPYVAPPLQCYKCQRIGHTANACYSAYRCMYCSSTRHSRHKCPKRKQARMNYPM